MRKTALSALALLAIGASASAQTITDGNALFRFNVGTAPSGAGLSDFLPEGVAPDHLFQNWWWYRVNGVNTQEVNFPWNNGAATNGVVGPANTLTNARTGLEGGLFDATLQHVLTDGTAAGQANLLHSMTVTNRGQSDLSIALFHYIDFDVNGVTANNTAMINAGEIRMRTTHPASGQFAEFLGQGANAFQVSSFATLRTQLTNAVVDNLNNTGVPHTGDFTGAYQWNLLIAPGGTATIYSAISTNASAFIPAPGAGGLLAIGALAMTRRRR